MLRVKNYDLKDKRFLKKGMENMKVSFNGARRNLAYNFNNLIDSLEPIERLPEEAKSLMQNMRMLIGAFLCMYDEENESDCDCITDIELRKIETD